MRREIKYSFLSFLTLYASCCVMLCSTILLKEGNVLFHDALNTLYLRLHGVRYMAKDHSDSERRNHIGDSFRLAASVILYSSSHKQDITYHDLCYTSRVEHLLGRKKLNGSTMKDRSDDSSHRCLPPPPPISRTLICHTVYNYTGQGLVHT